jgi:hypothetical protein
LALRARIAIASCFLVTSLAASSIASAQGTGLSAQDEANARFQTGLKYYDNHDFESARLAFKQAYAVLQKPSILLNLALSELYSNHPLDAIVHFEEYIKDPSTPADKRDKSKKHLEEAMKKTAHLQIRTAADAQVTIDGRPVSQPYTTAVHVMPGAHSVEARLGSKTRSANVDPKPGDTVPIDLTFEGEPSAPVDPPPSAATTTNASANANANPNAPTNNAPGSEPPPVSPSPSSSSARWIVPVALGVGALGGAAVGFIFAQQNQSSLDDAEALRRAGPSNICADRSSSQCQAYESKLDDASSQATISTVGYVASGVLLAGAIATFVFWPRNATSKKSSSMRPLIAPILTPSSPGAFASVTF